MRTRALSDKILKLERENLDLTYKYGVVATRIKPLERALRALVTSPLVRSNIRRLANEAALAKKPDPYTLALRALSYSAEGTHACKAAYYNRKYCGECGKRME